MKLPRDMVLPLLVLSPLLSALGADGAPNRVLDFDGEGDYVRLPSFVFTNLSRATIEAWVEWRVLNAASRVFDFGDRQREMYLGLTAGSTTPDTASMVARE